MEWNKLRLTVSFLYKSKKAEMLRRRRGSDDILYVGIEKLLCYLFGCALQGGPPTLVGLACNILSLKRIIFDTIFVVSSTCDSWNTALLLLSSNTDRLFMWWNTCGRGCVVLSPPHSCTSIMFCFPTLPLVPSIFPFHILGASFKANMQS